MALVYSSNQQPTTSADAFYRLITHLVSAGWTVAAAGDGLSAYSSSNGTAVTSSGSGANGFNNTNAWIFIKMPGSNRGFVFIVTSSTNVTIRYFGPSTAVTNTPSAATAPASATTNAASQDVVSNVAYVGTLNRVNYWADNTAPYGFGMHGWSTSGTPTFHFCLDGMQANTFHPLNQDPYVMITFPNTNNPNFLLGEGSVTPYTINNRLNSTIKCWSKYNMTGSSFRGSNVCMLFPGIVDLSVGNFMSYTSVYQPISSYDGKDEEAPAQYAIVVDTSRIYVNFGLGSVAVWPNNICVGTGTYIKNHLQWRSGTPNLDVLSVNSTYDRLCFGNCTVPNGGVFPTVP